MKSQSPPEPRLYRISILTALLVLAVPCVACAQQLRIEQSTPRNSTKIKPTSVPSTAGPVIPGLRQEATTHAVNSMAIGIDPTVDYAFKLLLGNPQHPNITLHFLNAVLGDQARITEIEIINPILGQQDDLDKLSILDVAARDSTGRQYDIEMQTSLPAGLRQ